MGQVKNLTIDMSDHEFAKPCGTPKCKAAAEWFGMSAHGIKTCPGEAYLCTRHKDMTVKWWSEMLADIEGKRCMRCLKKIEGQLSDVLKFIKL